MRRNLWTGCCCIMWGNVVLHMSEDVFWKSTLRKVHAVFKCHCEHMPKPASKK